MKRVLIALALICISAASFAQEHLKFKGVPITGSMTTFCQNLSKQGLTKFGSQDGIVIFTGYFTGRKATICVGAADNGKDVFAVGVLFEESESWTTLVNTYEHYKNLYTEKYGKPQESVEHNPSNDSSNISLMSELYQETVTYASVFEVEGGKIQISIEKGAGYHTGYVMIKYQDAQNFEAKHQSELNEI